MQLPSATAYPAFGRRLKRQRLATGLKQDALAAQMGLNQTTVSRWESGAQTPDPHVQQRAFGLLARSRCDDAALRRLVEHTPHCVHLVEEASHVCLAYSRARAVEWDASQHSLLGVSLWQFATDEIREAEHQLEADGWWDNDVPPAKSLMTSGATFTQITIKPGWMLWERIYLSDGTPARLVTGLGAERVARPN